MKRIALIAAVLQLCIWNAATAQTVYMMGPVRFTAIDLVTKKPIEDAVSLGRYVGCFFTLEGDTLYVNMPSSCDKHFNNSQGYSGRSSLAFVFMDSSSYTEYYLSRKARSHTPLCTVSKEDSVSIKICLSGKMQKILRK